jgi:hypothetical protein
MAATSGRVAYSDDTLDAGLSTACCKTKSEVFLEEAALFDLSMTVPKILGTKGAARTAVPQ